MLRLCNVPTIKQTWPWQISFESPFTKRSTTTCLQVQKHPSITWGKRFPVQTRCWSPDPQHLCVKAVRQPFFFLFFCRSVRSRSHARSDKASNLSGPKIYEKTYPTPNALTLMLLPGHQSKNKEKYKRIFKSMIEMFKSSNLQITDMWYFPQPPSCFFGIWTHYLDIFPHTECSKLDPKLPHIALPGWFLLEGICLRK